MKRRPLAPLVLLPVGSTTIASLKRCRGLGICDTEMAASALLFLAPSEVNCIVTALVDHANDDWTTETTHASLAAACGRSRENVIAGLARLEAGGYLDIMRRGGGQSPNVYRLKFPAAAMAAILAAP